MASQTYRVWFGFYLNGTKHKRGTHIVLDDADPTTVSLLSRGKIRLEVGDLGDLAVTTADLADLAVTTGKLAAGAVTTAKIGSAAAKGDLLAGTAAGAVTNLAVGSNGALLGASSGASTGLAWVTNRMVPTVGETSTGWPPNGVSTISATASQGTLTVWPVYIPTAMTISDLSIYVNGAAAAGALWRLGFWTLNGTDSAPSTLIADLGTVDPTGTGQKTISSLAVALTQGMVGFGYALQGSGAGGGTAAGGINNIPVFGSSLNDPRYFGWNKASETGAFGGTLGAVTAANSGLSMNFSYKRSA